MKMKKYFNIALKYAVAAMIWGVFYREFTKWNGFTDVTVLGKVHGHMFALGTAVFLIVALFSAYLPLKDEKTFKAFMITYNIGVPVASLMMAVRGIFRVLGTELSSAASASISGVAGIAHALTGAGIILLFIALKKAASKREAQ